MERFDFEQVVVTNADRTITGGYTSDLLSDVMANAQEGQVLITIQAHKNSIAVATLIGMPAIIICNTRPVPEDMIEAAEKESIALFRTQKNQFEVSGILYQEFMRK
ncbi:MAG TPA: hypothetical protein P5519_07765 [Spirochaetia bacterium]|nr:hypothetical protein [Spirochaetales bacterium]HPD80686.1 hypothetical protein [Spirochaetales bacterium]HQK33229.1 hypothetical protein [Spirochaetales bacterium]HRS65772.1 hypothetical protein [Spirochaetia bacterium]HRV29038.1 hypothetical protein [Spirochaetia bacterium]